MSFRVSALMPALTAVAIVAACGPSATAPAAEPVAMPTGELATMPTTPDAMPTEAAAAPAMPDADNGLSGPNFVAQMHDLSGQTVTVALCSLDTTMGSSGEMACRVQDEDGRDVKLPDGLPVDLFFVAADLSPDAMSYIAMNCADNFCATEVTGLLSVAEGTEFASMTDVVLSPAK